MARARISCPWRLHVMVADPHVAPQHEQFHHCISIALRYNCGLGDTSPYRLTPRLSGIELDRMQAQQNALTRWTCPANWSPQAASAPIRYIRRPLSLSNGEFLRGKRPACGTGSVAASLAI